MIAPHHRWRRQVLLLGAFTLAVGSCQELPLVEAGMCGNRVYEPDLGEDCDGVPPESMVGAKCGGADSSAPCRLVCSANGDADGGLCPSGWGCGKDGICRQPSAEFKNDSLPGVARGAGDVDGDGLTDVVMRGGQGQLEVAFFTEGRNLAEVYIDPRSQLSDEPVVLPVVANLTNDGIGDLVLPLIGDDVAIRVLIGRDDRQLEDPFVELVTIPFNDTGKGDLDMTEVFNPKGAPQALCDIGGCTQSLLLSKKDGEENRYAVLDDRTLVSLFTLELGRKEQSWAVARWDQDRPCDILAVSYRYSVTGSPGNRADLFSLCTEDNDYNKNTDDPLGPVLPITSVSVDGVNEFSSLVLSGSADIDGDQNPDLLINVTDNDPTQIDDDRTFVLFGTGTGAFKPRADQDGELNLADGASPLIASHPWSEIVGDGPDGDPDPINRGTWVRALDDINGDGRADMLLTAGIVVLSTPNPADQCVLDGDVLISGPPLGLENEPQWGYSCVIVTDQGLVDASDVGFSRVIRDWTRSGSLARSLDLEGDGRRAFAAIHKGKEEFAGSPTNHSAADHLDLFWIDASSEQLITKTITAERFEQVAAGDMDGDFDNDLVFDDGESLQVIRGAPFDPARANNFSPVGFDQLELFSEGLPSASLGAERDGRLTIFRNGQWPALALLEPGECEQVEDCHVRFATGALPSSRYFAWALGVIRSTDGSGIRVLRAVEGEANLGPAYDSTTKPLVPLSEIGISAEADAVTVVAVELGGDEFDEQGNALLATTEAVVIARVEDGVEVAVLRPRMRPIAETVDEPLCSTSFVVPSTGNALEEQAVCFDHLVTFFVEGEARALQPGVANDPFIEVGDPNADGSLDLTWVTLNNSVVVVLGDGSGSLDPERVIELVFSEPVEGSAPDPDGPGLPERIDWVRWIELDGSGGLELLGSDLSANKLWGLNVSIDGELLDPRGFLSFTDLGERPGYVADFDGDGVDDMAVDDIIMFGTPLNAN